VAESLFFRFVGDDIEWVLFDGRGQMQQCQLGTIEEFCGATAEFTGRSVLVVPGEQVLLTTARVPSKQHRQIVQAVPYVVEEQLACDIEQCFFALGNRTAEGDIRVAVIDQEVVAGWIKKMSVFDFPVMTIVSENDLVAAQDGVQAIQDGERVHLGWHGGRGITAGMDELPLLVSLIRDVESLEIEADSARVERQLSELEASGIEVTTVPPKESSFLSLCLGYNAARINLRQGIYKPEEPRTKSQQVWRSVAVLLGLAVMLHLMLQFGQGWYLSSRASEVREETLALYRDIFPSDRNVRDIRRRWNSHLGSTASASSEFISLFARASRGLPTAGLTLNSVNFNESRGDLILQVTGSRSEALVQYTQQLSSQGMNAEIGTISQEDGSIRGSIKVRLSGGAS
jgi:general secretion pathway protein L